MSNADTVRAMFEAWARGDMAASAEPLHPEIVWDATRVPMDDLRGVYHGREGVSRFWRGWLSAWETIEPGEPELVDGGDRVVVWLDGQVNRGRGSGIEVRQPPYAFVWTFRDGLAIRMELHVDRAEALAAAGLE
jgi:ketosteroid isomerase-like protein